MKEGKNMAAFKMTELSGRDGKAEVGAASTRENGQENGEQADTSTAEREKSPEEGFAERQRSLIELKKKIKELSMRVFSTYSLLTTGGDVLVQKYGAERVVDALRVASEDRSSVGGDLEKVINTLEPSSKERQSLYAEIAATGNRFMGEAADEYTTQTGVERTAFQRDKHHIGHARTIAIQGIRALDEMKAKIGFLSTDLQNRIVNLFSRQGAYSHTIASGVELATRGKHAYGHDWEAMKADFASANGDLVELYNKLHNEDDEITARFGKEKETLVRDIREEISKKEGEARQAFEQKLVAHLADLDKIREQAMKTEAGQELMETAVKAMEKTVGDMKAKVEQEIGKSTEELRRMLEDAERTSSLTM